MRSSVGIFHFVVVLSFIWKCSSTVTMNRNGDLLLHSLMGGDIVFAAGSGDVVLEQNSNRIDLLRQLDVLNSVAGQLCWLAPSSPLPTWAVTAAMPTPSWDMATVVIGQYIYLIGGSDGNIELNTVQIYNTLTDSWSTGPSLIIGRTRPLAGATSDGSSIYVFGGAVFSGLSSDYVGAAINSSEVFDVELGTWSIVNDTDTNRYYHLLGAASVVNNYIYFFGGIDSNGIDLLTVSQFDLDAGFWLSAALSPMISPRDSAASVAVGTSIYVIGGKSASPSAPTNDVQVFDTVLQVWSNRSSNGLPRFNMAAVNVENLVLVLGGKSRFVDAHQDVDALNPRMDLWRNDIAASMITGREGFGAAVVNDVIYVFGGRGDPIPPETQVTQPIVTSEYTSPCF